jgi:hypothetical protein
VKAAEQFVGLFVDLGDPTLSAITAGVSAALLALNLGV